MVLPKEFHSVIKKSRGRPKQTSVSFLDLCRFLFHRSHNNNNNILQAFRFKAALDAHFQTINHRQKI